MSTAELASVERLTRIRGRTHRTTEDYLVISELKIDLSYHRPYDANISAKMLRDGGRYIEEVGRYILVSRRNDADYVIAGFHRSKTAEMDGHELIPAVICHGLTVPEEAELARIEANRRKEGARDQFRQEYVAGFPEARRIVAICEANGVAVYMGTSGSRASSNRSAIDAVQTLRAVFRRDDGKTLARVLRIQRKAWMRPSVDAKLLRGMADVFHDSYHKKIGIQDELMIKALNRAGEKRIHELARDRKPIEQPLRIGYFRAITEEYSRGRRSNRLPTPWR